MIFTFGGLPALTFLADSMRRTRRLVAGFVCTCLSEALALAVTLNLGAGLNLAAAPVELEKTTAATHKNATKKGRVIFFTKSFVGGA